MGTDPLDPNGIPTNLPPLSGDEGTRRYYLEPIQVCGVLGFGCGGTDLPLIIARERVPIPGGIKALQDAAKKLQKNKLNKKKCVDDLKQLGINADQVRAGAAAANIVDGTDNQMPLATLYPARLAGGVHGTIGERLASPGVEAVASLIGHDIYVDPNKVKTGPEAYYQNLGTVFHEVLHNITGFTDPDLQRQLGLKEQDISDNITQKLIQDCF